MPYPLSHADVRRMAELRERVLRLQFDNGEFSGEDESALAALSLDDPTDCFLRYRHLVGMWFVWERGLERASVDKDVTAHLLIRREPVHVRIAGRVVSITSRSRHAMVQMARHERQRKQLGQDLDRIEAMLLRRMPRRRRKALLRKADEVSTEWEHHFRGVLANALSESGRAADPGECPEWWAEVTAADEGRLLMALMEVGPARYQRLGKEPKRKESKKVDAEFGFESLLAAWEPKLNLPPASLQNHDLAQFLTWLRAGAVAGVESNEMEGALR